MSEQTVVACGTYDMRQAAERLGVSVRTVRRLKHEQKLPTLDLGLGIVRFSAAAIDRLVEEGGSL